jgi:hypothetical protein
VIQWDLLFFAPLNVVYPKIPHDAIALSGLIHLDEIADVWAWTVDAHLSTESEQLLQLAKTALGYRGRPYACIGPGYSLSRTFLERFSAIDVVDIGHDELRVPLFAQLLGIEIVDTGFAPLWTEPAVEAVFNADANEIDPLVVERELLHGNRRVFHPCRERFDRLSLKRLVAGMSPTD